MHDDNPQPDQQATRRTCLACGKAIKGRSDKKYCDDYCRNNYNNQLRGSDHLQIRNINNTLKKNRNLLATLLPAGAETMKISMEKMLSMGFHFKYFTHQYTTKKGSTYCYCYYYGYLRLDNNWVLIVADREA